MDAVGHVDRRGPWLRTRSVAEAHVRTVAEAHGRTQEQGGRKARGASFYTPTGGSGLFLVAGARATDSEEGMTTKATTGLLPMFEVVRVWCTSYFLIRFLN